MAESGQRRPGPFLPGDATRLVAICFAIGGVLLFLLGISLLVLVRQWLLDLGFGVYTYLVIGVPLTLGTVVAVTAGAMAIAYGLWAYDADAWLAATALSAALVLLGIAGATSAGIVALLTSAIGVVALVALWIDRSLFDVDGRLRS